MEGKPNRLLIVVILLGVAMGTSWLISYYTDWLWFKSLDYQSVFWRMIKARFASGIFFGALAAVIVGINLWVAGRFTRQALRVNNLENAEVQIPGEPLLRSRIGYVLIGAVLALAPFLNQANTRPGLSILREMPYLEALRWARFRRRGKLVTELSPLDYISRLGSRPLLLIYGDQDGITPVSQARAVLGEETARGMLKSLPGNGHLSLPGSPSASGMAVRWFKENL